MAAGTRVLLAAPPALRAAGVGAGAPHTPPPPLRPPVSDPPTPGFRFEDFTEDHSHPNDLGHGYAADLLIAHLIHTLDGLDAQPFGPEDSAEVAAKLMPPLYRGNVPQRTQTCHMGARFKELAVKAEGFEWVNEGTPEVRRSAGGLPGERGLSGAAQQSRHDVLPPSPLPAEAQGGVGGHQARRGAGVRD